MTRGRELLAGAVMAAIGVAFSFALLEVGVRVLHLVPDRFWEPDPQLGVRLMPGHAGWWTQEDREFVVPIRINGHGLRDVERDYAKPPGVLRVLVIGDSFVEAMHVPLEATFPRQLEQLLNTDGKPPRVEVISAGVSGYGTASELLYFQRDGKRYEPDLVILSFYPGNDVKNNSPTLEADLPPRYAADGTLERVVGQPKKAKPHGVRGLIARSAAYRYFRQVLLLRHPGLASTLVKLRLLKADAVKEAPRRDGIPVDFGVYATPADAQWQDAWRHTERLLADFQRAVEAAGARFMISIVSARDQVYPDSWKQILAASPAMQGKPWDVSAPQARIEAWCAAHQVPCIAQAPGFERAAQNGSEQLHFMHDGHWTSAGHRLAATTLKQFIEEHHLVPRGGGSES